MSDVSVPQQRVAHRNLTVIGVLLALSFWVVEALIHVFLFHEGTLFQNLFPTEPNELWMRMVVCSLLVVFGIYAQSAMTKLKLSQEEHSRLQGNVSPTLSIPQRQRLAAPMIFLGVVAAVTFWILESLIHSLIFHEGELQQVIFPKDPNELWMRLLVSCLLLALGIYAHVSITKLRKSEEERFRLQKRLEEALTKVLSGFIPICANCKDIRQEDDRWVQIEAYIHEHSAAEFSHGICPKCVKLLYPDQSANR